MSVEGYEPDANMVYRATVRGQSRILSGYTGRSYPGGGVVLWHFAEGTVDRDWVTAIAVTSEAIEQDYCTTCYRSIAVKRNGSLYPHGPRNDRCPGDRANPLPLFPTDPATREDT